METNQQTSHISDFNSDLLNLVDQLLKPLSAVFCLLAVICLPLDAYEFLHNPTDYIWVHHLDTRQPYWQWQYLQGSCWIFLLAFFGLGIFILSYTNWRKKQLQILNRIFALSMIIWIGFEFYQWAMTGFDH